MARYMTSFITSLAHQPARIFVIDFLSFVVFLFLLVVSRSSSTSLGASFQRSLSSFSPVENNWASELILEDGCGLGHQTEAIASQTSC